MCVLNRTGDMFNPIDTNMSHPTAQPLPSHARDHFDLVTHWRLRAPVEQVWSILTDPECWPLWWPYVKAVQTLKAGGSDGVGGVRRIDWTTRLPYRLVIEVETVESLRHQRLRGRSRGQLDGEGLWLLREEDGFTDVTYVWRVRLAKPWMRWMAPLLASVFRWNHESVMRAGETGLRRWIDLQSTLQAGVQSRANPLQ